MKSSTVAFVMLALSTLAAAAPVPNVFDDGLALRDDTFYTNGVFARAGEKKKGKAPDFKIHEDETASKKNKKPKEHDYIHLEPLDRETDAQRQNRAHHGGNHGSGSENRNPHARDLSDYLEALVVRAGEKKKGKAPDFKIHEDETASKNKNKKLKEHDYIHLEPLDRPREAPMLPCPPKTRQILKRFGLKYSKSDKIDDVIS